MLAEVTGTPWTTSQRSSSPCAYAESAGEAEVLSKPPRGRPARPAGWHTERSETGLTAVRTTRGPSSGCPDCGFDPLPP